MDFFAFLSDTDMSSLSVYHSGLMFIWALLDCGRKQRRLNKIIKQDFWKMQQTGQQ